MKISLKLNFLPELCPGAALILRHLAEMEACTWHSRRLSLSWNAKTSHVRMSQEQFPGGSRGSDPPRGSSGRQGGLSWGGMVKEGFQEAVAHLSSCK